VIEESRELEEKAEKASNEKKQIQRDLFHLKEQYQQLKSRVSIHEERIKFSPRLSPLSFSLLICIFSNASLFFNRLFIHGIPSQNTG
jgi:hypothetical protein